MNDLFKQDDFRQQYELAKSTGDKRFGSECKHSETKGGHCTNCLRKVVNLTGLFREYCRCCHLVQTYGRDHHNLPLCQGCAMREQAWDDLQAVPAYVERSQSL